MAIALTPQYFLERLKLLEELQAQFLGMLPEEVAEGVAGDYNIRLAAINAKHDPDAPAPAPAPAAPSLILVPGRSH